MTWLTKSVKCGHPLPKIKRMSSLKISIKRDYDNFQNSWLQNYIQSSQLSIHNGPKTFMKSYLQLYTLQLFHSIHIFKKMFNSLNTEQIEKAMYNLLWSNKWKILSNFCSLLEILNFSHRKPNFGPQAWWWKKWFYYITKNK